jgi:hypothetical protein
VALDSLDEVSSGEMQDFDRASGNVSDLWDQVTASTDCTAYAAKILFIYIFPEKELRGLSPNFHIHVSVSDLYFPRIGPLFPAAE